ncbi:MAG: lactate utilization protein [Candidatus Omnitrophica bacterium]|jgi:hypothetical protein|nr:lactate utilization protein [Candidatus Omnitrophota bacterium]MDD5079883.1 lactate utilization protein [Candidatus Omnitrophota bacterium]
MQKDIAKLLDNWNKRNIKGIYLPKPSDVYTKLSSIIPVTATVGFSGSRTLEEIGLIKLLEARGNKVFNPYKPGLTNNENMKLRKLGAQADYYLSSANAIARTGELVFFSAFGQRIAGLANARHVIIIAGRNKVTDDLPSALERARQYVAPLNCKRLDWPAPCHADGKCHKEICFYPEYKRMCCQTLIIEAEPARDRLRVILVGTPLGF